MSKITIDPPEDDFGQWIFKMVTGQDRAVEIEIPGTPVVAEVQQRVNGMFELFDLLKEMNENMVNIDNGIKELNDNIKALGLGGLEAGLDE